VLADGGHDVVCIDADVERIENPVKGIVAIYEPGLAPLVAQEPESGRLTFSTDTRVGVERGKARFIALGILPDEDGSAELQWVLEVADTAATHLDSTGIIVDISTVPAGAADRVAARIRVVMDERGEPIEFHVASNPEFLKKGAAVADCTRPDRFVAGLIK
jgi:UDPglucose 6-dehydrogenase